ncbi:MAG: hypothetical protein CL583_06130 [Alteromonadaceae bacterium]|nr:hypothetical protein [Alteromonadaceae bacterium]
MSARVLWFSFILLLSLALGACSESSSSSSPPNSFPPPDDDFTEGSSGDAGNTCSNLAANELCVTVEVPRSVAGDDATATRRNLFVIRPTSVEAVRVSGGISSESLAVARRRDNSGSLVLTLEDYESIPLDADLVIVATLGDGTVIRGPLSDVDQDVKLNPFSEYLVAKVLDGEQLSAEDIEEINTCGNLCLRRLIWPTLADTVQDFEITIPSDSTIAEAVALLSRRVDFTGYVSSMVDTMKVDTATSGPNENSAATFNTVYFGLELNRAQHGTAPTGQWGTRRSITGEVEGNNATVDIYPTLSLATFREFGLEVNSIAGEFPYHRETQLYPEPDNYQPPLWEPNSHAIAPGFVLAQSNFLRGGRSPLQEVTQEATKIWGWASNPYFYEGVQTGEAGSRGLLAGYFHAGKAIELEVEDGKFNRLETLEDLNIGSLEVDLQQISSTGQQEPLDLTAVDGTYSAVSFSVRLGNDTTPVEALVQMQNLESASASANAELTPAADTTYSGGWSIKRESAGGAVQGPAQETATYSISLENEPDQFYANGALQEDAYYGRITAQSPGRSGLGAAVENGDLLAYTFQGPNYGQGINIVAKQEVGVEVSGEYTLQGVALGMTAASNRLEQLNGAVLSIAGGTGATSLTSAPVQVIQNLSEQGIISDPRRAVESVLTGTTSAADGRFEITLGTAGAETVLQGYTIEGGDVLVMMLKGPDRVGLVLGFRE